MPISLLKKDKSRQNLLDVFDLMKSGEIYAPGESGTGGEFIVQENRFVADPSGQVSDLAPFQRETGVKDYMTSQTAESDTDRLMQIQEMTGAGMTGLENKLQFDPSMVERFEDMSSADKLAAQMVQTGQMNPKDFYSIQKKSELDRQKAMLDFFSKIDPQKSPISLMSEGQDIPMTNENLMKLMEPGGKVDVKVGRPYPSVSYHTSLTPEGGKGNAYSERTKTLKASEITALTGLERSLSQLDAIENLFDPKLTGFIQGPYQDVKSFFGQSSEHEALFRSAQAAFGNALLHALSGAAVNEHEYKRLVKEIGKTSAGTKQFLAIIKRARNDIQNHLNIYASNLKVAGRDMDKWETRERPELEIYEGGYEGYLARKEHGNTGSTLSDEDKVKAFLQKRKK